MRLVSCGPVRLPDLVFDDNGSVEIRSNNSIVAVVEQDHGNPENRALVLCIAGRRDAVLIRSADNDSYSRLSRGSQEPLALGDTLAVCSVEEAEQLLANPDLTIGTLLMLAKGGCVVRGPGRDTITTEAKENVVPVSLPTNKHQLPEGPSANPAGGLHQDSTSKRAHERTVLGGIADSTGAIVPDTSSEHADPNTTAGPTLDAPISTNPEDDNASGNSHATAGDADEPIIVLDDDGQQEPCQSAAQAPSSAQPTPASATNADNHAADKNKSNAASITAICSELLKDLDGLLLPKAGHGTQLVGPELALLWRSELEKLGQHCLLPETVVGVVGATGAGKSSMLNALLGEEDILPTNGMRACTASVVEAGFAPGSGYSAEVDFMTREEWLSQLEQMWDDIMDAEEGKLKIERRPGQRPDTRTDAGAAQAVIESVLGRQILRRPDVTLDMLKNARSGPTGYLGTTERIREYNAKEFRKRIGGFVDSNNRSEAPQTWPLVKVVRIKHNWEVLSGGVLLVDLPGTRDANAARGAIAEKYLRKCNAVFVVADITRAVDDKTAKDLIGKEFRRQMLMDGQYGSISFICTKTDQVDVTSTITGLGVDQVAQLAGVDTGLVLDLDSRLDQLRTDETRASLDKKRFKRQIKRIGKTQAKLALELQHIESLLAQRAGGSESDLPADVLQTIQDNHAKRPRLELGGRSKIEDDSSEDEAEAMEEDEDEEEDEIQDGSDADEWQPSGSDSDSGSRKRKRSGKGKKGSTLTKKFQRESEAMDVDSLQGAHTARTDNMLLLRDETTTKQAELRKVSSELHRVEQELSKKQQQMNGICAMARNAYSRGRLKEDFRSGLVDMADQAHDRVGEDQLASLDLPVFCVSARDCQKLEGRCKKDGRPHAFNNKQDTNVPALRDHVKSIGDQGREFVVKRLLTGLCSFVASTVATLLNVSTVSASFVPAIKAAFQMHQGSLHAALKNSVEQFVREFQVMLLDQGLLPRLASGAGTAQVRAVQTVVGWASRMHWATYRATTRRDGVFRDIDFNSDLAKPILDSISVAWDGLFGRQASESLNGLQGRLVDLVDDTLRMLGKDFIAIGVGSGSLDGIRRQVLLREQQRLRDAMAGVQGLMHSKQKDLSRDVLVPTIQAEMARAYQLCQAESGVGTWMRIKGHMSTHVANRAPHMFNTATHELRTEVTELVKAVKVQLDNLQRDMGRSIQTHFSTLWEVVPCNEEDRCQALHQLHQAAVLLRPMCEATGVPAVEVAEPPKRAQPAPGYNRESADDEDADDEDADMDGGEEDADMDGGEEDVDDSGVDLELERMDAEAGHDGLAANVMHATHRAVRDYNRFCGELRRLLSPLTPEQQLVFATHAATMDPEAHAQLSCKQPTEDDVEAFVEHIGCLSASQWREVWQLVAHMDQVQRNAFAAQLEAPTA